MPKAKPFPDSPDSEEEEKTTIESQWEDEASTTVEQGDVAEKIRSLGAEPRRGGTNVTGTGALDEPTVDDQHAQMSALTPVRDVARLLITQGNDAGNEIEIRPGKTYTIGRAIDNDVVLTDIAVSRKHFDLRFEDGAWVIVDRGSGNGTVVNGNLEDNPFMLANGDVIEIGNTVFRFDQPNAASRANPQRTIDLDGDEEELSTVAGKPLRDVDIEPMPVAMPRPQRPKTLPPPTPLRSAAASQPPPLGYPPIGPASLPQPSTTLPMPQMANRPPIGGPLPSLPGVSPPQAPTMLADHQLGMPMQNQLPTTIPGQGAPPPRAMYPYPQATEIPPHSVHAQMLLIQTQNRRGDHSTAHVSPTPYDAIPVPPRYSQPQLTKKAKLVLAGIGLAVFAAVMTVAIVKSGTNPKAVAGDNATGEGAGKLDGKSDAKVAAKTTVEPIKPEPPKPAPTAPTAPTAMTVKTPTAPTAVTVKTPPAPPPAPAPVKAVTAPPPTTPTVARTVEPPKTTTPPPAPPKAVTTPAPTPTVAKTVEPPKATTPPPAPKPEVKPPPRPEKVVAKAPERTRRTERSNDRKAEARRVSEPAPSVTETPAPKKAGGSPDAAIAEAEKLYRARKFGEASSYLAGQAKKFDEDVARDMRKTADYYGKLGKALSTGTAPATRATVAYEALRSAQNYDRNLSNEYDGEIQTKLAQVAPKAALSYIAQKNYPAARSTMLFAKQFPAAAETVSLVKQKLESAASELYDEAVGEMSSNPSGAKEKLKLIMQITDQGSTWYKKATQKLSGG